jgi:hypothetical protein
MKILQWGIVLVSAFSMAQVELTKLKLKNKEEPKIVLKGLDPQKLKKPELAPLPPTMTLTDPKVLWPKTKASLMMSIPYQKSDEYMRVHRFVADEKLMQHAVDTINSLVVLPRDLLVLFNECGKANAFYSPPLGRITMCSEMIALLDTVQSQISTSPEQAKERIRGAFYFIFFHEFGHALVHELDLPTTGREEDVVDQFATLLLLENGADGAEAAMNGALFFLGLGEANKGPIAYSDEHSLEQQRFYNIACWLYGANPFERVNLVAKGILPAERAARCGNEYQQMRKAWKTLADPKLKRPLK